MPATSLKTYQFVPIWIGSDSPEVLLIGESPTGVRAVKPQNGFAFDDVVSMHAMPPVWSDVLTTGT